METVPADGKPGGNDEALRFLLKTKPVNPWNVQYAMTLPTATREGQKAELHFFGRSKTGTPIQAVCEKAGEPYTKALYEKVELNGKWKEVVLPFSLPAYPAGGARVAFHLGLATGEVELTGVRLIDPDAAPVKYAGYPPAGTDLLAALPFRLATPHPENLLTVVPAEGKPGGFAEALRVALTNPTLETPWTVQLQAVLDAPIAANQVMLLKFWGRSATKNAIAAIYERHGEPYTKTLNASLGLSPKWREYAYVITSPAYPAQGVAVNFQLGFGKGEVELARIRLINYGVNPKEMPKGTPPEWYGGMTHSDAWLPAANARINRFRKGNLVVTVVDAQTGKAIPDAQVSVRQTRHAFLWGTAITDDPLLRDTPDGQKYRETLLKYFNYAVLENQLKQGWTEGRGYGDAEKMLAWCKEHNLPIRGHNLFWPGYEFMPDRFKAMKGDPQKIRAEVENHVREETAKFKGKVVVWDAVNEALSSHAVYEDAGGRELVADVFKWAHDVDPNTPLAYNENEVFQIADDSGVSRSDARFEELFAFLKAQKAPVSVLGMQSHMSVPLVPGALIAKNLEKWRGFGLPLEITEFDAGIPDDAIHAQYMEEFMTAVFAEPSVRSFVQWGYWENRHWRATEGGALIRKDWTWRPGMKTYADLVYNRWWTKTDGKTGDNGTFRARAFLGTYAITATRSGKSATATATVTKNEDGVTIATVSL